MPSDYSISDLTRNVRTKITVCGCGCWVWTGSSDSSGYAKFKIRNRTVIVHRYVYEALVHPLSTTETIDHLCDRHRTCVNPAHFEPVTRSVNSSRANDRRWHGGERDFTSCTIASNKHQPNQGDPS
jgi:hypothetical protein